MVEQMTEFQERKMMIGNNWPGNQFILVDNGEYDEELFKQFRKEETNLINKISSTSGPVKHQEQAIKELEKLRADFSRKIYEDQKERFKAGLELIKVSKDIDNPTLNFLNEIVNPDEAIYVFIDWEMASGRCKEMRIEDKNMMFVNINYVYNFEIRKKG